jgi:hypothetical protein
MGHATLPTSSYIQDAIQRVFATGRITPRDARLFLRAAASADILSQTEMEQVKAVCDRLQMGLLKVVD